MTMTQKILLVEDNPDDEALTLAALRSQHMAKKIIVVRDGQEALDYLFAEGGYEGRDIKDEPQVILLDLQMPKIDGLEVLKRVQGNEHTRHIPVVVLTTSTLESDMMQSYDNGANSFLCKPVNFEEFIQAIQKLESLLVAIQQGTPWLNSQKNV